MNAVTAGEPCLSGGNPALVLIAIEEFYIRDSLSEAQSLYIKSTVSISTGLECRHRKSCM